MPAFTKFGRRIVMVTAYDALNARAAQAAGVDWLLVGDSAAMVVHGMASTRSATHDMMRLHTQAVRRGSVKLPIVTDLPYASVRLSNTELVRDARALLAAGADAVKIEWTPRAEAQTAALIRARIPVMGHVGLTPQDLKPGAAFKIRGADAKAAQFILRQAAAFERIGAFAVVFECVPEALANRAAEILKIPVIGIGAGRFCDGQVLVFHDLVGLTPDFGARFVKRFADAWTLERDALSRYVKEVRSGIFPAKKNVYRPIR